MEGGEEVGRDGDTLAAAEPLLAEKSRRGGQTWSLRDGAGDGEMILNSENFGVFVWRFGEKGVNLQRQVKKCRKS
jgi:hypothetical protein